MTAVNHVSTNNPDKLVQHVLGLLVYKTTFVLSSIGNTQRAKARSAMQAGLLKPRRSEHPLRTHAAVSSTRPVRLSLTPFLLKSDQVGYCCFSQQPGAGSHVM